MFGLKFAILGLVKFGLQTDIEKATNVSLLQSQVFRQNFKAQMHF